MKAIALLPLFFTLAANAQVLVAGRPLGEHPPAPIQHARMSCDTTLLFYTASGPQGLAVANDLFWVMYNNSQWVIAYDDTGAPQDTLDCTEPWDNYGGLYHENGNLWLIREQAARLYHFNLSSGTLLNMFQLPMISADPNYWGIERLGPDLVVSFYSNATGGTTLYRVDPANGAVLDSSFVNGVWLLELQVINGELFGMQVFGETMHKVDPLTGTILASYDWCLPYALGADVSFAHGPVGVEGNVPAVFAVDSNLVTGNEDDPEGRFAMHPNPAGDVLTLDLPFNAACSFVLRAMDGRLVKQWRMAEGVRSVPLADLPTGAYVATVNGPVTFTRRLVIAR